MLRISKLTDYGVIVATALASKPERRPISVSDLSAETGVPQPTVAKLLKLLARQGVVESFRGAQGGYALGKSPERISVAEIIAAIEGPIAITECSEDGQSACSHEAVCEVRGNWQRINQAIQTALDAVTLRDMVASPKLVTIARPKIGSTTAASGGR